MHFFITNNNTRYNGNEILRKYNKKSDTYGMYICTHTRYSIITGQDTNEYRKIYNK